MEFIKFMVDFIKKMIEVNGLFFIMAIIVIIGLMAIITKITGDKSWYKRMMEVK